ncbi:hypothetical protein GGF37_003610 [Kickxella alabastrina]|nr:hypothetical protein GGF37_003610 [Kickxella alabastrina]
MTLLIGSLSDCIGAISTATVFYWALPLTIVYITYRLHSALTPPPNQDGGVPYIPVHKSLRWMLQSTIGRYTIMQNLQKPYFGDPGVVRIWMFGVWEYSINNAEFARTFFTQSDIFEKVNVRKMMPHSLGPRVAGRSLVFENGSAYRGHRAVVSPAFRRLWPAHLFRKPMDDMIHVFETDCSKPVEVLHIFYRTTIDVLGHIVMGYDFEALRNPGNKYTSMYDNLVAAVVHPIYNMLPWLDLFSVGNRAQQWKNLERFNAFLDNIIEERLAEVEKMALLTSDERDNASLLTLLLESYIQSTSGKMLDDRGKPVTPLTKEELRDNIGLIYVAGYDTTANALSFAMMELARYPEIQKKARDSVLEIIGDTRDAYPTDEQIKQLIYLDSVLKETMRKNSIVTDIRRCLSEPVQLGPYTLPKGATVSIDSWSMHYNPANFPEPEKFIPERFAEDKSADVKAVAPYTFTTFSNGSRQCSGMKFALIEQRIAMALLLLRFEWTLPADSPFWHSTPSTAGGLISPVGLKL